MQRMKNKAYTVMLKRAKKHLACDLLVGIPGAGPVISMGYLAMIVTPHRLSKKNKLWRYAGLGNTYHEFDGVVYKRGPVNRDKDWENHQTRLAAVAFAHTCRPCDKPAMNWFITTRFDNHELDIIWH